MKLRHAPSGDVLGYNVALPGDRNRDGDPIWFPGSKLAPDLSLPKIRQRLATGPLDQAATATDADTTATNNRWSPPAKARRHATQLAESAALDLDTGGDDAAAQLVGVGELLDAVVQTSPAATRDELRAAARAYERATRSHVSAERADNRALRSAARGIIHAGGALGRGEDGGTTAMLLSTLVLVALAAARWHSARGHAQQAVASRQAAEHLRTAYRQAATTPMKAMHEQGRALPEPERRRLDATIRAALPETVGRPAREERWDALAATLAQAEQAGYDPDALLQEAIAQRELGTAQDVNDVLVWRLRRLAKLPAHPETPRSPSGATGRARSATSRAITSPTTPAVTDPRNRAPRR